MSTAGSSASAANKCRLGRAAVTFGRDRCVVPPRAGFRGGNQRQRSGSAWGVRRAGAPHASAAATWSSLGRGRIAWVRQRDIGWIHLQRVPGRERDGEAAVAGAFDHDTRRAATHRAANDTAKVMNSTTRSPTLSSGSRSARYPPIAPTPLSVSRRLIRFHGPATSRLSSYIVRLDRARSGDASIRGRDNRLPVRARHHHCSSAGDRSPVSSTATARAPDPVNVAPPAPMQRGGPPLHRLRRSITTRVSRWTETGHGVVW